MSTPGRLRRSAWRRSIGDSSALAALSHAAVIDHPDVGPMGEGLQAVLMQPILPALHDQEIAEVIHKKLAVVSGYLASRRAASTSASIIQRTTASVSRSVAPQMSLRMIIGSMP